MIELVAVTASGGARRVPPRPEGAWRLSPSPDGAESPGAWDRESGCPPGSGRRGTWRSRVGSYRKRSRDAEGDTGDPAAGLCAPRGGAPAELADTQDSPAGRSAARARACPGPGSTHDGAGAYRAFAFR